MLPANPTSAGSLWEKHADRRDCEQPWAGNSRIQMDSSISTALYARHCVIALDRCMQDSGNSG